MTGFAFPLGCWRLDFGGDLPTQIYPLNDLREHVLDGISCWCCPKLDDGIIIHNSMDQREAYEEGRKPS